MLGGVGWPYGRGMYEDSPPGVVEPGKHRRRDEGSVPRPRPRRERAKGRRSGFSGTDTPEQSGHRRSGFSGTDPSERDAQAVLTEAGVPESVAAEFLAPPADAAHIPIPVPVRSTGLYELLRTKRYDSWNASYEWQRPGLKKTWMNVTALFASFFGIVLGPLALVGVVFGHLGLRAARRGEASLRPFGIAALWIGYIASIFWLSLFGFAIAYAAGWTPLDY